MLSFKVALNDRQYLKYTASVMKEVRDMNPELEKQATNGSCSRSERFLNSFYESRIVSIEYFQPQLPV